MVSLLHRATIKKTQGKNIMSASAMQGGHKNELDPLIRFDRTPTCDEQTDRQAIARTTQAHSAVTAGCIMHRTPAFRG